MVSSEDILLQFTGEDNVSSVVEAIGDTVSDTISAITSMFGDLDDGVNNIIDSAEDMNNSLGNLEAPEIPIEVDDSEIDDTLDRMDEFNDILEEVYPEVDDSQIEDTINKKDELNQDTNFTANVDDSQISDLSAGLAGLAGVAGMAGLDEMMDTAGRISDSWNRLDLTFGGVTDSLKSKISDVASETGRSGATTRNYFNMMGIAGVQNVDAIGASFESMAGFAYQSGKDVETLSASMQRMVMSGNASARMLGSMGISMDALAQAMGVSASEVSKAFKELTPEERMNALVKAMGDGTKANEMYKNSWEGTKEKASAEFAGLMGAIGTPILQFMIPVMHQLTSIVETITGAFKKLPAPVQTAIGGILAAGVGLTTFASMIPIFTKAITGLQSGFNTLGSIVGQLPNIGGKFASFGKQTETVVKDAQGVGSLSGQASSAGSGMKTTSVSLKAIGQGAMSMVAPLLEIAIVIAIMIPVITALVAEALLFLKGLQLLIDALDFDSINLDGAINGIKQVATAIAYVGVAMGAMTFTNILTATALLTSGLTGIISPIQIAGALLKQASEELSKLALADIDPSIPERLRKISESLKSVGSAMNDLTGLTLNLALGNLATLGGALGNISTAVETARKEITHAGEEISKLKDLPDIDQSAVDRLKKVSDSLKSVSDAFNALRGLRDGVNWDGFMSGLFGGADIQTALSSVKEDIVKAGNAISQFNGLPDIPQEIADKLKRIGDSLKSVGDAIGALRKLRDDGNWDSFMGGLFGGKDIQATLSAVKTDLEKAGQTIASFQSLPSIPDGVSDKVNKIADATNMVGDALNSMKNAKIPDIVTLAMMPVRIALAKTVLQNIGNQLNGLVSLPQMQEGIAPKVTSIANVTTVVGNALNTMQHANIPDIGALAMLPVKITMAKMVLENTASQLRGLQNIQQVPDGLGAKLNNVATGATGVANAARAVNTIPYVGPEAGMKVGLAVGAIKTAMNELKKLQGEGGVNVGGVVNSVRNALNQVRAALSAMQGSFYGNAVGLGNSIVNGIRAGLNGLGGAVNSAVSSGINSASGTAHGGGQNLGNNATNGFRDNLKLADVAKAEMDYAVQAINSGSGALAQAAADAARKAVQAAKDASGQKSPGHIARAWGMEFGVYSVEKVRTGGEILAKAVYEISQSVVKAWGSPELGVTTKLPDNLNGLNMGGLGSFSSGYNPTADNVNGGAGANSGNTYIFNKGAFQIDARNKTENEAKQMLVLALENLSGMNEDIRGI